MGEKQTATFGAITSQQRSALQATLDLLATDYSHAQAEIAHLKQALADQSREHGAEVARYRAELEAQPCHCVYGVPDMSKTPASNLMGQCSRCAALTGSDAALQEALRVARAEELEMACRVVRTVNGKQEYLLSEFQRGEFMERAAGLRAEAKGG